MREPSEGMIEEGIMAATGDAEEAVAGTYNAMIDAALEE